MTSERFYHPGEAGDDGPRRRFDGLNELRRRSQHHSQAAGEALARSRELGHTRHQLQNLENAGGQ